MRSGSWMAFAIGMAAVAACGGDKDETDSGAEPADTDTDTDSDTDADADADTDADTDTDPPVNGGFMRYVNVSQPYGRSSLFVDAAQAPLVTIDPLAGTPWREIASGPHTVKVTPEGTPVDDPSALQAPIEIVSPGRYTVVLYGPAEAPVLAASQDDLSGIAAGSLRYVFTNTASGVGPIDVVNMADGAILADDLTYGQSASVDLTPSALEIAVDLEGDGVLDLSYGALPAVQPNVVVPVWFTLDGANLVMAGSSPTAILLVNQPTVIVPPDTTPTTPTTPVDTSDTGP